MGGQKNGENLMWAWIQQSNPTATFGEVSSLYRELGEVVVIERERFFQQEQKLQAIKNKHDNLCDMFPNSLVMSILGRKRLIYTPILSTRTKKAIETGIDDEIYLFD